MVLKTIMRREVLKAEVLKTTGTIGGGIIWLYINPPIIQFAGKSNLLLLHWVLKPREYLFLPD